MNLTALYHTSVTNSILSSCLKRRYIERQHSISVPMNDERVLFNVILYSIMKQVMIHLNTSEPG